MACTTVVNASVCIGCQIIKGSLATAEIHTTSFSVIGATPKNWSPSKVSIELSRWIGGRVSPDGGKIGADQEPIATYIKSGKVSTVHAIVKGGIVIFCEVLCDCIEVCHGCGEV